MAMQEDECCDNLLLLYWHPQAAENTLELVGQALGDRKMLQLALGLMQRRSGRPRCTSKAAGAPDAAGMLGAHDPSSPAAGPDLQHNGAASQQCDLVGARHSVTTPSPALMEVLLARFVPQDAAVVFEAWNAHVLGLESREEVGASWVGRCSMGG